MLEFLVSFLGELLLQIFAEVLLELGVHAVAEPFRRPPRPWMAALGYALFGAVAGGLSLWVLPQHLLPSGLLRALNVLLVPVLVGACMAALGRWRSQRGHAAWRIDSFSYGYLFALAFALIRFQFAG